MTLRRLFTGILTLGIFLAGCATPTPTLPPSTTTPPPIPPTGTPVPLTTTEIPPTLPPTETPAPAPTETPDPARYTWAQVAGGLEKPTDITGAGDGSGRLFLVEQPGRIRILKDGQILPQPFLDISGRVGSSGFEQGLLGLAFHPRFTENGYFYVNYTDQSGHTRISRFTASGDFADPNSEQRLLFVEQPFANHNGGAMKFGPDGYLYIGLGDGGSGGDPYDNGQSLNTLLGKILRIDVDNGDPYAIPTDNPFASGGGLPEIWAYGLRNPWRISFDRATADLWMGDVGQGEWEEIDRIPGNLGGANFGWNEMEGTHPFEGNNQPEYVAPVTEYSHSFGCSVTGGFVYRGPALPEWQGTYFYGDYCSGAIWGLDAANPAENAPLFQTGFRITTFGEDDAGELYVADQNTGGIYRLERLP